MYPEFIISMMALIISALGSIAALYVAQQLSNIRKTYSREAKASQMERTLHAVQLPFSIAENIETVLRMSARGDFAFANMDSKLFPDMLRSLEHLETLATGINSGVYDEDIAYARLGDRIIVFYEMVMRVIYEEQSRSGMGLYVQLTQLARHWQSRNRHSNFQY